MLTAQRTFPRSEPKRFSWQRQGGGGERYEQLAVRASSRVGRALRWRDNHEVAMAETASQVAAGLCGSRCTCCGRSACRAQSWSASGDGWALQVSHRDSNRNSHTTAALAACLLRFSGHRQGWRAARQLSTSPWPPSLPLSFPVEVYMIRMLWGAHEINTCSQTDGVAAGRAEVQHRRNARRTRGGAEW